MDQVLSEAISALDQIDRDEQNWRSSRTKIRQVINGAVEAGKLLDKLGTQVKDREDAVLALEGKYNKRLEEINSKTKESADRAQIKIGEDELRIRNASAVAEAAIRQSELLVVNAKDAEAIAQEKLNTVNAELDAAKAKLEEVKEKHASFLKSIGGA